MPFAKYRGSKAARLRLHAVGLRGYSKTAACLLCLSMALVSVGCGGRPLEVKVRADLPSTSATATRVEAGGLSIEAEVLRDEDYLNDTFDSNLLLAGVLPVRVKVINNGQGAADLSKARFEIKGLDGRGYKQADTKKAFKRLISYYEISTYSKPGYKESQQRFTDYALDLARPVDAGQSREGLVFFIIPEPAVQSSGLRLIASRLDGKSGAVELKLN